MTPPSDALMAAWRECFARIAARAAVLMVEHDDWSVAVCVETAKIEEVLLYGVPGEGTPIGILGVSPIQSLKAKAR